MLKMLKNRGRGRDNFQKDFLLRNLVHFKCWAIIGEISGNIVVGSYSVKLYCSEWIDCRHKDTKPYVKVSL